MPGHAAHPSSMAISYSGRVDSDPLTPLHRALGRWLRTGYKQDAEKRAEALSEINQLLEEARRGVQEHQRDAILDLKASGLTNRQTAEILGFSAISRLDQLVKRTRNQTQTPPRPAP